MENCLFCKIIVGEIPSEKVFENEWVYGFKDISPVAPVHILLIPKKHIESINDISEGDGKILEEISYAAKKLSNGKDYRLVSNIGSEAGQSVFHLHFHLISGRPLNWPPG